jgi:predicted nucleic acid-binding protein
VKLLVDVNVFIDVLTKRMHWEGSLRVLNLVRQSPEVEGWISALTIPLLYFFRLRVVEERQARTDAQDTVKEFRIVPLTQEIIADALASTLPDFEDNIQLRSAESIAVAYLITRNKKHFQPAQIPVLTPEEWLALEVVTRIETDLESTSR